MNINLKTLLSLAVVVIMFGACKPAEEKTTGLFITSNIITEKLKGNVKEITFLTTPKNITSYSFDKSGVMRSLIAKSEDTYGTKSTPSSVFVSIKAAYVYKYDKQHRLAYIDEFIHGVSTIPRAVPRKEEFTDTTRYYFDTLKRIAKSSTNINSAIGRDKEYQYEKNSKAVRMAEYYRNTNRKPEIISYKYDNEGRLIEYSFVDSYDVPRKYTLKYLKFDSLGNWIERSKHEEIFKPSKKSVSVDTLTRKITYYE